jgi:uncharacterized protein
MLDDLDRPLGMDREPPPRSGRKRPWLIAGVILGLAGFGIAAVLLGGKGEPEAVAPIQPLAPPSSLAALSPSAGADGVETAQQVETESGVKVFRGGAAAPGSVIIRGPGTDALTPAPDPRLVENSKYGLLPRRASDGASPSSVYASPSAAQPPIKPGTPRITLVIGGMGLNAAATGDAIRRLPAAVTLAFAPYGADLAGQAAAAREAGHEILLQSPMESFNSADFFGPHVLSATDSAKAADDLRWQMGRFVGYIGVMNFLGGRFTANQVATQGFMRELAARGLDFVDDGSSPQSLAGPIASQDGVGFVKADLRLDESLRPEAIDAALAQLESLARERGFAVGYAAGLPAANERIARFAAGLERRGLALVPLSAAIRGKSSTPGDRLGEKR